MDSILKKITTSIADYTERRSIISAATPLEFSKRDGTQSDIFAVKIVNSSVTDYEGAERATNERVFVDVMCFVETIDSHSARDMKYELLTTMYEQIRSWALQVDNSELGTCYLKYIGIINTVDDQPGFYALTIRLQYEINL